MATKVELSQIPAKACKFCQYCAGSGKARVCRYNPPRATGFPRVAHDDWCSKYTASDVLIDAEIARKAADAKKAAEIEKALNPK